MIQFKRLTSKSTTNIDDVTLKSGQPAIDLKNQTLYVGSTAKNDDISSLISTDSLISGFKNKLFDLTSSNISGSNQNFGGVTIKDSIIGGHENYAPYNSIIQASLIIGTSNSTYNQYMYNNIISGQYTDIQPNTRQLHSSIISGDNLMLNPSSLPCSVQRSPIS